MSLEESMLKLAASMDRYADTLDRISKSNPTHIGVAAGGTSGEPAATDTGKKPTAAEKKAAKEAAEAAAAAANEGTEEVDPFADDAAAEDEAPELTADVIRQVIMKVKDKNKEHAMALIKKVGATTISNIPEAQYPKVIELAAKLGVTL